MIRPLDTATLGPICERPNLDAARARIVREALAALANEPSCGWLFGQVAESASDATLAKLGRMLK